jgi:hypothetical protein
MLVRGDRHVLIRYIEPQDGTLLLRPQPAVSTDLN